MKRRQPIHEAEENCHQFQAMSRQCVAWSRSSSTARSMDSPSSPRSWCTDSTPHRPQHIAAPRGLDCPILCLGIYLRNHKSVEVGRSRDVSSGSVSFGFLTRVWGDSDLLISIRVVFFPLLEKSLHAHCRLVPLHVGQSVKPTSH